MCEHKKSRLVLTENHGNGIGIYRGSCTECGSYTSNPIRLDLGASRASKNDGCEWWGWYSLYLKSPAWKSKRLRRLRKDKNSCVRCGDHATVVHHLTYKRAGHELLSDLISMCEACHEEEHEYLEERRAEYRNPGWW